MRRLSRFSFELDLSDKGQQHDNVVECLLVSIIGMSGMLCYSESRKVNDGPRVAIESKT